MTRRPVRIRRAAIPNSSSRKPFWFGHGVLAVQGEGLGPRGEVLGREGRARSIPGWRRRPCWGQVPQAGVLRGADPVPRPGPAAVPQLQRGQVGAGMVGGETGDPVPVDIGQAQLGTGMGPPLRAITRIPGGQESDAAGGTTGHPRPVADLLPGINGGDPRRGGQEPRSRPRHQRGHRTPRCYPSSRVVSSSRNAWLQAAVSVRITNASRCAGVSWFSIRSRIAR